MQKVFLSKQMAFSKGLYHIFRSLVRKKRPCLSTWRRPHPIHPKKKTSQKCQKADHQPHVGLPLCHASFSWQACPCAGRRGARVPVGLPKILYIYIYIALKPWVVFTSQSLLYQNWKEFMSQSWKRKVIWKAIKYIIIKVGGPSIWGTYHYTMHMKYDMPFDLIIYMDCPISCRFNRKALKLFFFRSPQSHTTSIPASLLIETRW